MYLAQYLRRNTITRVSGPRPTTRICRSHGPGLNSRKKKHRKETKGKDDRKYIKHKSIYHKRVVRSTSKKKKKKRREIKLTHLELSGKKKGNKLIHLELSKKKEKRKRKEKTEVKT